MISVLIGISVAGVVVVLSVLTHAPHVWPGAIVAFLLATASQFAIRRWDRRSRRGRSDVHS
jgi:hypothetical protein